MQTTEPAQLTARCTNNLISQVKPPHGKPCVGVVFDGLLDGFNPHLALAALIFASVVMILKKLSPLLKQTKEQKSDETKPDDSAEKK